MKRVAFFVSRSSQKNSNLYQEAYRSFIQSFREKSHSSVWVVTEVEADFLFFKSQLDCPVVLLPQPTHFKEASSVSVDLSRFSAVEPHFGDLFLPFANSVFAWVTEWIVAEGIDEAFFWSGNTIFRSLSIVAANEAFRKAGLPFRMPFKYILKRRTCLNETIRFQNKRSQQIYRELSAGRALKPELEMAFQSYLSNHRTFKADSFYKRFEKPEPFFRQWRRKLRSFVHSNRLPQEPFILLLLNKPGNWMIPIVMPELFDETKVVEELFSQVPQGVHLVVKDHPSVPYPVRDGIWKLSRKIDRLHYLVGCGDTEEQIQQSMGVVSIASTAFAEALLRYKPLLTLGNKPPFFGHVPSPVFSVEAPAEAKPVFDSWMASRGLPAEFRMRIDHYFRSEFLASIPNQKDDPLSENENWDSTFPDRLAEFVLEARWSPERFFEAKS